MDEERRDDLSPEQIRRVDDVAAEALGVPSAERGAFVQERCRDDPAVARAVLALLAQADRVESEEFLDQPAALPELGDTDATLALPEGAGSDTDATMPFPAGPVDEPPPAVPGYRVLRRIAGGGMGVVWLAEQANPRREVALKVIRPGMASGQVLERFRLEAHVLGRLHHPGIAQVYEAGTHDSGHGPQPFFAMEYIREAPASSCSRRCATPCTTRTRRA